MRVWWNWQTRKTQNLVRLFECGFDSHHSHFASIVQRSGHRPVTAETRVRFPLEALSPNPRVKNIVRYK